MHRRRRLPRHLLLAVDGPESSRRAWRRLASSCIHSTPPELLLLAPSPSSTTTERRRRHDLEADVATDAPKQNPLVKETRHRRLPRSPPPIEDDELPTRRQLPRDLAGPVS